MNKHSDARAEANCNCRTLAAAYLGEPVEDVTLLYHWSTCPLASGERERLAKRWDDPRCATCGEPGMTMTQTWASTSGGSGETTFRVPWCAKHPPVRPNPSPGMVASCGKCGALPSEPCPEPAHCPRVASGERALNEMLPADRERELVRQRDEARRLAERLYKGNILLWPLPWERPTEGA